MLYSSSTPPLPEEQSCGKEEIDKYGYLIANNRWHEIPIGETKIGRDASLCTVALDDETVSKEHAVVESEGPEDTFIYDVGSTNKTKFGKMILKPHCRYKINDNDVIKLGSINVQYRVLAYKFKNHTSDTPQLCSLGENVNLSNKENINSTDESPIITNKSSTKDTTEIFRSPSMSLLKGKVKMKKYYYSPAGESSPAVDIFSQATQCEVTEISRENNYSDHSQAKCINDDIYNLSTQCEYAGDFIKPKVGINSQKLFLKNNQLEKSKEVIDYDFNDSGTFDFMKGNKTGNHITSYMSESFSENIFDLATQCEKKQNDSAITNENDELTFRNKINQPRNAQENLKIKLIEDKKNQSGITENEEERNLISLSDGEDEELCELMRMNSPVNSTRKNSSIVSNNNHIKTEFVDAFAENDASDEIFDIATQVPSDMRNTDHIDKCTQKLEVNDKSKIENTLSMSKNQKPEVEFNKPRNVPCLEEDMIMTQVFSSSHHIPETNLAGKSNSQDKVTRGKACEGNDYTEDMIATQLFERNDCDVRQCSQDDIATQLFPSKGGKPNEESQILSVIVEEAPAKPVPDIVLLCDSGDETESDLEIKLCLASSVKKEGGKRSSFVKQDPDRPSSASSDKTVSDLDIAEMEEASCSLLKSNTREDFIATQIFASKASASCENVKPEIIKKNARDDCEDFISTQIFPIVNGMITPSKVSDKTESDIAKPAICYVSSEDEENSNESESLIKQVERSNSSSPVLVTVTRPSLTPRERGKSETESVLTLSPSHPAFEAFSEIDGLIGMNGKSSDRSDSGIGAENFLEIQEKEKSVPVVRVTPDSDETDCEEELEAINNRLGRQETFVISKPKTKDIPSTSNPTSHGKLEKSTGKPVRTRTGLTRDSKSKNSIKSYFHPKASDSPMKRALLMNSDDPVPTKRVKNTGTGKKKPNENTQADDIILTQSLKLRNRVVRPRKAASDLKKTEMKTPGSVRRAAELNSVSATETVPRVRSSRVKTDKAIRKLIGEFQTAEEDSKRRGLRPRKSNGDDGDVTRIVFTGFESDCHDRIIHKLGGERVNHLGDGHILVTDRVRRTVKFLSAVALGLPIVSPKWLLASEKEMKFLNPWDYLLEDKPSEERWGFNLKGTLEKWRKQKLLKGYTVFATESTRPPVHEMLSIVKCCGGSPVTSRPEVWPEKSIVLTCVEDKKSWPPCKHRQVKIVHYEFLLSGVLKYFMDFKFYKLR